MEADSSVLLLPCSGGDGEWHTIVQKQGSNFQPVCIFTCSHFSSMAWSLISSHRRRKHFRFGGLQLSCAFICTVICNSAFIQEHKSILNFYKKHLPSIISRNKRSGYLLYVYLVCS